jgi:7-cyano-7-deazaguanine synthase in queuosine biosynthesis
MRKQELVARAREYFASEPDEDYKNWAIICYSQKESYTCNRCDAADKCRFAWDFYNIGGDCLAEK